MKKNNMFLDGLPDEDFRGWRYDPECNCIRCRDFLIAAKQIREQDTNAVKA